VIEGKVAEIIVNAYQSDYFGPRDGNPREKNLLWLCNAYSEKEVQERAKAAAVAAINELLNGEWKVAACEVGAYFVSRRRRLPASWKASNWRMKHALDNPRGTKPRLDHELHRPPRDAVAAHDRHALHRGHRTPPVARGPLQWCDAGVLLRGGALRARLLARAEGVRPGGLLHDASEAYLKDIPAPLKRQDAFAEYREAEERLGLCVAAKFGLSTWESAAVKHWDKVLGATERRDIMRNDEAWVAPTPPWPNGTVLPWSADDARAMYLRRYADLVMSDYGDQHALGYCRSCHGVLALTREGNRPLIGGFWRHVCGDCGGDFGHQLVRADAPAGWQP
jgi:hypothetical protein